MSALKRWQLLSADLFVCDGCCNYRAVARHRVVLPHHATSSRTDAFKNKSRPLKTWCIHCFSRSCPGGLALTSQHNKCNSSWTKWLLAGTLQMSDSSFISSLSMRRPFRRATAALEQEQARKGGPSCWWLDGKSSTALLFAILIQQHQRRVQSTWIKHCTMGDAEWETDRSFSVSVLQLNFSFSANVFVK